ncbi:sugar fermentation stimulation protein [Amylibacter marinus]|uniref:Sugar fermentation stimulation protein homolog n=1 Tax=Amylibacter marinus TaxID=1475483 RepID=A0ABQ5VVS5_9RHOB|nr:DNA/RNA nuclease SfsA [Amylibacter marinus]GLQ35551.1 sugar fermentation stimulation protein [Amylibacter marinus]
MKFESPLIRATLIRRYKRFLADVTLEDGTEVTAHVANPGSMLGLAQPGMVVWLEPNDNPKRKLNYSWKLVEIDRAFVGVDTGAANHIVKEALSAGDLDLGYADFRAEVKYGENSRVDFLLSDTGKDDLYLEVKSMTLLRQPTVAEFPDSVTARGAKHLRELVNMVAQGHRAALLYLIQRTDAKRATVAVDIDPDYAREMIMAREAGVVFYCFDTVIDTNGITLGRSVPLDFPSISDLGAV